MRTEELPIENRFRERGMPHFVPRGTALVCGLLLVTGCQSITPPTELDPDLGARIDTLLHESVGESAAPGIAVMVIRDGVVVFAEGYGLADLETGRPITRTTPFRLASVTKQFTCMAILRLAENGRLSLDDAASDYVPSLERFGRGVTIRHLMQHTSGLPEYYAELERLEYKLPSADNDPLLTAIDASKLFESWGEPLFKPGEQYAYSNPGYEQLALIIETASGQTFGEYLRDSILEPAVMRTAVVRDRPEVVIPERAVGYARSREGGYRELDDHPGNWIVGAGGLYASLDDFYFWDRALSEYTLVSEEMQAQAIQPVTLNDGKVSNYGFGWGIDEYEGRPRYSHGGSWVGFRTHIARYPADRVTIVVLSNLGATNTGRVARDVAELVFADA
jgi:CubicO group peptidase (beta-lactamase class C family)